jgi:Mycothiol maleylpyruvate isomerase N-terminal domain
VIRQHFLDGARVVVDAIGSPAVGAAWDQPSILEHQTVGSLAGHVARAGVWVVAGYLDQEPPAAPTFDSAADYYATIAAALTEDGHRAVRDRSAAVAATGWAAVGEEAAASLAGMATRLAAEPGDRTMPVAGGAMRLDDYLATRIVEQVVHLDDLARSVGVEPWPVPEGVVEVALTTGVAIGARRSGAAAMVRALFRRGEASILPVLS